MKTRGRKSAEDSGRPSNGQNYKSQLLEIGESRISSQSQTNSADSGEGRMSVQDVVIAYLV